MTEHNARFEELRLDGVGRQFGGQDALQDLNLTIRAGEFIALLGPSGCGKSTALNCLAGLLPLTAGSIWQDQTRVDTLPPERRGFGMVFQNYALFPHMSVRKNIAFGLEMRRLPKADIKRRVAEAVALVKLEAHVGKLPGQLSGGQQQRVAVARALVFEPKLILMDEPLGALDKQLREQMQLEIRRLHQRLGVTMVYVTHDQSEALTMSDRIAVFHRGRIQQLDTPKQMYEYPKNAFVARFIGENNRLVGSTESTTGDRCTIRIRGSDTRIEGTLVEPVPDGGAVTVSLRPERVQIQLAGHTINGRRGCSLAGTLREIVYLGDHVRARVALNGSEEFTVKRPIGEAHAIPDVGAAVEMVWEPEHCRVFAQEN